MVRRRVRVFENDYCGSFGGCELQHQGGQRCFWLSDGAYDGAVGDRYVFGSYANNRVTDMWNLTWAAGAS
jgi:hypothetical protein